MSSHLVVTHKLDSPTEHHLGKSER